MKRIDADRLIARVMRLSHGDLTAQWTAGGLIKLIEEEEAIIDVEDTLAVIRTMVSEPVD